MFFIMRTIAPAECGRRGTRGFTLPELLVVLALMALTAGLAFNAVSTARGRTDAVAKQLARDLELARARAIFDQNDYVVTFSPAVGTVTIHDDENSNGGFDGSIGETLETRFLAQGGTGIVIGAPSGLTGISGGSVSSAGIR